MSVVPVQGAGPGENPHGAGGQPGTVASYRCLRMLRNVTRAAFAMAQSGMAPRSRHAVRVQWDRKTLEKRVNSSKSLARVIT